MRNKTVSAVALAGVLLGQLAMAGPSSAASPVVTRTHQTNETASAQFTDIDGCIATTVTAQGGQLTVDGTVTQNLRVTVVKSDTCTSTTLFNGLGVTIEDAFNMQLSGTSSAHLAGTLDVTDSITGQVIPTTIDFSLKANNEPIVLARPCECSPGPVEVDGATTITRLTLDGHYADATGAATVGSETFTGATTAANQAAITAYTIITITRASPRP